MVYPEPGTAPKIQLSAIPANVHILGLAPFGVRWEGTKRNGKIIPYKGCPVGEFSPCYAYVGGIYHEIVS